MAYVTPNPDRKFFISWIVSSAIMYTMFYFWHGFVLNDFLLFPYPKDVFLIASALVYLSIGLMITVLTYALKKIKNSFKYGLVAGASAGFFIYLMIFVLGISFSSAYDLKVIAFDLGWQIVEQAAGGLWCGWIYRFMYIRERSLAY